jgi:flagellar biosynthesis component FlhA
MPKYVIMSERVGEIGAEFDAEAAAATGVNIDALVEGGFISAHKSAKSAKKDLDTSEE